MNTVSVQCSRAHFIFLLESVNISYKLIQLGQNFIHFRFHPRIRFFQFRHVGMMFASRDE